MTISGARTYGRPPNIHLQQKGTREYPMYLRKESSGAHFQTLLGDSISGFTGIHVTSLPVSLKDVKNPQHSVLWT